MAISRKPCTQCKKPVELQTVPALSGEDGGYRISLESVPAMVCADNHKRLIHPEFALQVMDAIVDPSSSGLYAAPQRGLLKKRTYCAKCGSELAGLQPAIRDYRVTVAVESAAPMVVALSAPCLKCTQCGTEQLPREQDLNDRVFKALAGAFRSAELRAE